MKKEIKEKVLKDFLILKTPKKLLEIKETFNEENALKVLNWTVDKVQDLTMEETTEQIKEELKEILDNTHPSDLHERLRDWLK
jgi:hypothetical protein